MVKVKLDLSELEIQMLSNCIEAALDTKHIPEKEIERVKKILEQLNKYR